MLDLGRPAKGERRPFSFSFNILSREPGIAAPDYLSLTAGTMVELPIMLGMDASYILLHLRLQAFNAAGERNSASGPYYGDLLVELLDADGKQLVQPTRQTTLQGSQSPGAAVRLFRMLRRQGMVKVRITNQAAIALRIQGILHGFKVE